MIRIPPPAPAVDETDRALEEAMLQAVAEEAERWRISGERMNELMAQARRSRISILRVAKAAGLAGETVTSRTRPYGPFPTDKKR